MNYSDYCITYQEYITFRDQHKVPSKLSEIWQDILRRIDNLTFKKEAEKKGFDLIDNPDMEEDVIAKYKMIIVPQGSEELHNYIIDKAYPFVVCLK